MCFGNLSSRKPCVKWAYLRHKQANAIRLHMEIFLRHFSTDSEIDKRVLEMISASTYEDLLNKYESFLRMEDAPIKKVGDCYLLVNYEEAWMTLQIDATDAMSSRMHETVIAMLTECQDVDEYSSQPQASIIHRLIFNYIYFRETSFDETVINGRVKAILEYAKLPGCKEVVFKSLSRLAEAAPTETLNFIETEAEQGVVFQSFSEAENWSGSYQYVLWALDKLVMIEDTAIRACKVLYKLSKLQREYHTSNSPTDSLLNALCLWANHTAIPIRAKTRLTIWFIEDNCSFGAPFAIKLISKTSVFTESRIGEKTQSYEHVTYAELYSAHKDITSAILDTAIRAKCTDWIVDALKVYWYIPCEVLNSSVELLASAALSPEQKMPIIYEIRNHLYYIQKGGHDDRGQWIESFNRWLDCLISDDPVSKEGWRFYEFFHPPFPELLSEPEERYFERETQALIIREQVFRSMRDEYGSDAVMKLVGCMEDSRRFQY